MGVFVTKALRNLLLSGAFPQLKSLTLHYDSPFLTDGNETIEYFDDNETIETLEEFLLGQLKDPTPIMTLVNLLLLAMHAGGAPYPLEIRLVLPWQKEGFSFCSS